MSDDDVELNHLRERVYGAAALPATPDEIARLTALEEAARARRAPSPAADHAPAAASLASAEPVDPPGDPADEGAPRDAAPPRHRALAVIAAVVAAGVLLGAGYAAGVAAPSLVAASATPSPTPSTRYPELAFPQTDDDVISASIIDDSGIDPATTRYIAVMRGFRVFLAQPERGEGVCVVTFIVVNDQPWSAGCTTGGPFDDGAVFGIDRHLSVALGDTSRMSIRGTPVRLSESVTAYVTE
ncbi:MAG: hypothetical protein BGO45_05420 [Microbacterium sp. 71-36]|uniref:hypothetical protein n=1 Tax=unclassified Microbacterium TaxID=2609290 RepID=UPI0009276EB6|nr:MULTISPECIES: hypothetical protein [unclassified Microbacterium]MBN9211301.1 hypothetical protein [Microbacterium sp.]OJV75138.1 MAG: hypothetical protein BGO45_05420 [Microbacterium sp. 71-36]